MIKIKRYKKAFVYRNIYGNYLLGIPDPKDHNRYLGVPIVDKRDGVWISPKSRLSLKDWYLPKYYNDFLDLAKDYLK